MKTYELAMQLIQADFAIIPCYPRSHKKAKGPMTLHGQYDASTNPEVIKGWFGGAAEKLIGIPCKANGFFVVDVDGPEGKITWDKLVSEFGLPEPGPMQRTPHGQHHLFQYPDFEVPGSVKQLGDGLDLRANNYICSGDGYDWIIPFTEPIPQAPQWLLDKIKALRPNLKLKELDAPANEPPTNTQAIIGYWLDKFAAQANVGNRNDCAYRLGLQLNWAGVPVDQAIDAGHDFIHVIPQSKDAFFSLGEYATTIRSAYKAPMREAATLPRSITNPPRSEPKQAEKPRIESEKAPDKPKVTAKPMTEKEAEKTPVLPVVDDHSEPIEPTERPRYIVRDAAYFLSERPKVVKLVGDWIEAGSVGLVVGLEGAKKTWAMIDLSICTAGGKSWLGMPVKQGPVLFIDEESGDERLSNRMEMTMKGEMVDNDIPIYSVSLAQFNLLKNPSDVFEIITLIQTYHAKLVIIDALADVMLGGDENAVKDTQPVFAALSKIAAVTGAEIVVIHHLNKGGGYRGYTAIAGAIDTMLLIESKPESNIITFNSKKNRDGMPLKFAGEAVWIEGQFYIKQSDVAERVFLTKAQQYALDYFREQGEATLKQLTDYADDLYSSDSLKKAIQYLISQDYLTRTNTGGSGRAEAIYGIKKQ